MKNTRKFLIVLLALAISFACTAVVAFAADSNADQLAYNAALAEHKKVLEYYEAGYYLNADFDDATDFESAFADSTDEVSLSVGGAFEYVIDSENGTMQISSVNPTYIDFAPETPSSFGIKARVKLAAGASFSLYLHSSVRGAIGDYLRLFSVSEGKVSHKLDCSGSIPSYVVSDSAVTADTYFELDFFLDKKAGADVITLVITPDGAEAEVFEIYSYDNTTTDFLNGKFDFNTFYLSTENAEFDTLQVYKGSFIRDLDNSKNVELIANDILNIKADYDLYKNKVDSEALELLEIVASLVVKYNYDVNAIAGEELSANVSAFATQAVSTIAPAYAAKYAAGVAAIDPNGAYYERLSHLESIVAYSEFLGNVKNSTYSEVAGIDYAELDANIAKVAAEEAALLKAKEDTIAAVAAAVMIPDVYLATYADYREVYAVLCEHPICATYYDDEINATIVNLASKVANVVLAEYPVLNNRAVAFAENVVIASNTSLDFAERYAAYTIAKANKFEDTTYDAYLDGTTVSELLVKYDEADAEISVIASFAEEFLSKIDDASKTPSYSVKTVALEEASAYLDTVERGYPGVVEAIELYTVLLKDINDRIVATQNYIQAVIDVQNASTIADKKAAIEIANELAVFGSDVSVEISGFDITVTEANIILSNEESAILLAEVKVANYISAVNELKNITDIAELRSAIIKATALKANADATADGVTLANTALSNAIADYNARIADANAASEEVNYVAVSVLGSTVPTKRIGEIVAIVKKIYD